MHMLFDEENSDPFVDGDLRQHGKHSLEDDRCETEAHFVYQQKTGPGDDSTAEGQHLLFAARGIARQGAAARLQAREIAVDLVQIRFDLAAPGAARSTP